MVNGRLTGGKICREGPVINHLFFADDSILFAKANERECRYLKEVIRKYECASGQLVNFDKSEMMFSRGTPTHTRIMIGSIVEVREVAFFKKYLGVPTMIGRSRKPIFAFIRDRIHKRMDGWKENYLSKAGREVLINSIVQSIPTFKALRLGVFGVERKTNGKFLGLVGKRFVMPMSKGGLGFRNVRAFNLAMLAKQVWRLYQYSDSLCGKVFCAKYFPESDVLKASKGKWASYV
ncbi:uncharacterized protein LOC126662136 [Mercurialis annua]|uniref:uncharacterized protein LOC126662136 n=1 Tax=Mercurialis annua TaxID=3986 RepID=UPI00215E9589|nr:uncharacterized protein LOC126662136 [Mercurialis annua]